MKTAEQIHQSVVEQPQAMPAIHQNQQAGSMVMDVATMKAVQAFAQVMSKGLSTVPEHLRGKEADCMAVVLQAMQWKMIPHVVAQKTHIVNGTLGYEAQLVNAVITSMAPTKNRINYEWFGDWTDVNGKTCASPTLGVRVFATMKGETEPRVLEVTMAEVGVRNSPLWVTSPKIQLAYLGTKRWARLHCPDVILGVYTPDELEDIDTKKPKPMRQMGPAEVVEKQAEDVNDEYKAYEDQLLPDLKSAAMDGLAELTKAFSEVPPTSFKAHLWSLHGVNLKAAASKADEAAAEAAMQGEEVAQGGDQ